MERASPCKGSVLVTGTGSGLGNAIVANLALTADHSGANHGIYSVRDASASTPGLDRILQQKTPSHSYDKISLDLSSLAHVRTVAADLNARVAAGTLPRIRALILNAGYMEFDSQTLTQDAGLDLTFVVNYLGHWLLVLLMLQSMDLENGRIVWISSWSHDPKHWCNRLMGAYGDEKHKTVIGADLEPIANGRWSASRKGMHSQDCGYRRYGSSKICCISMLYELQRRLDQDEVLNKVSVLAVDPGTIPTGIARRSEQWVVRVLIFEILLPSLGPLLVRVRPNGFWRTLEKSAADVVAAALDNGPSPLTPYPKGLYLNGSVLGRPCAEARDPSKGKVIWDGSVRIAGITGSDTALQNWE